MHCIVIVIISSVMILRFFCDMIQALYTSVSSYGSRTKK